MPPVSVLIVDDHESFRRVARCVVEATEGFVVAGTAESGEASIEAAANPANGDWHFFVTVDPSTGETKFAVTQEEHDRNVRQFQAWCSANPGKC